MKKVLVICNTMMQVIISIQMRLQLYKQDYVTIVVSDQGSKDSKTVLENIKSTNIFDEAYFVETKELCEKKNNILSKISDLFNMTFGKKIIDNLNDYIYDEMLFYNPDVFTHIQFSELKRYNKNLISKKFEEGILSYNNKSTVYSKLQISNSIRKFFRKDTLEENTKEFICFYPSEYKGNLNKIQLPLIDCNSEIGTLLGRIFNCDCNNITYTQKYIYFSSVYDFEGEKSIGELNLILKIAQKVGKDNLLVKVHPRDNIQRFVDAGLSVDSHSSIPWEVIQLGRDFSNHIFLTVNSTSPLSISLLQKKPPKIYYLFPLCDYTENSVAVMSAKNIQTIFNSELIVSKHNYFSICYNLDDIIDNGI